MIPKAQLHNGLLNTHLFYFVNIKRIIGLSHTMRMLVLPYSVWFGGGGGGGLFVVVVFCFFFCFVVVVFFGGWGFIYLNINSEIL